MHKLDQMTPSERMAGLFGGEEIDRLPLIGNVSPNATMMMGNHDDIYRNIKENLKAAYDSPCGYIIATGCDIPLPAAIENVDSFMQGVRDLAKYPLDPALWD